MKPAKISSHTPEPDFITNIRTGESLRTFSSPVRRYKTQSLSESP